MNHNTNAISYIRKPLENEPLQLRIPGDLKRELQTAAKQINTSTNQFVEAAIRMYLDSLKKEGNL